MIENTLVINIPIPQTELLEEENNSVLSPLKSDWLLKALT